MNQEVQYYLVCYNDSSFEIGEIEGGISNLGSVEKMDSESANILSPLLLIAYQHRNKVVPFFSKYVTLDDGNGIKMFGVVEPNASNNNMGNQTLYSFWFDSYIKMQDNSILWLENGVAAVRNEIIDSNPKRYRMDVYPETYPNNGTDSAMKFCETVGSVYQFGICLFQYLEQHNLNCYVIGYGEVTDVYLVDDQCL